MSQSYEYPMFSPHDKAKLYKRLTSDLSVELKDNEIITVEDNQYVHFGNFTWVETTSKENNDDQPVDGLIVKNGYLSIRTNSLKTFETGDLVMLPKGSRFSGLWVIGDGIKIDYVYTPKQVQTYQHLSLIITG